jgi:uncharacterized protein (DUF2252 family)
MKNTTTQPRDRQTILEKRRNLKMARSAHAYARGNTLKFYEWLTSVSVNQMPRGPAIWICGDCHVGNLGPLASTDGRVEIAIRDLDQTVIGNPAHDLIRLGLSLATAARGSDLPGVTTAQMLEKMIEGYERALSHPAGHSKKEANAIEPVKVVLKEALKRKWRQLAEERIEDISPKIPLGECFWPLSDEEKDQLESLFKTEETRTLVTSLRQRDSDAEISIADAAYWVKGCSSLGRLRYAVLVRVGKRNKGTLGLCLIDIKEAAKAAAPHAVDALMPRNNAERILQGARHLSPLLGQRMLAARVCARNVVIRELLPQDLKLEMEELTCEEAIASASFLAGVVGRAHGRQMSGSARKAWISELKRNRPKSIEAPTWLWTSVVELIAIHEKAYLDHCRRYALHVTD